MYLASSFFRQKKYEKVLKVLEMSRANLYASLSSNERAAFAEEDGWLLFCTSLGSLKRDTVLRRYSRRAKSLKRLWF